MKKKVVKKRKKKAVKRKTLNSIPVPVMTNSSESFGYEVDKVENGFTVRVHGTTKVRKSRMYPDGTKWESKQFIAKSNKEVKSIIKKCLK